MLRVAAAESSLFCTETASEVMDRMMTLEAKKKTRLQLRNGIVTESTAGG